MTKHDVKIPSEWGCIVRGALYSSDDPDDLSEDMIEVRLPNGMLVCAGWCDSDSRYEITVTLNGRLIIEPSYTKSAVVAGERIIERIENYRWRNFSTPNTDDTEPPPLRVVRRDPTTNRLTVV